MRHTDAPNDLQDGFEPSPLPPIAPDGAPQIESQREPPADPPRLCAAGPCRNYHTFRLQLDAQNPMNIERDGTVFHAQDHHYCYPSPGVETNLGSLPVLQCNRWAPTTRLGSGLIGKLELVLRSRSAMRAYKADLDAFYDHQRAQLGDVFPEDMALGIEVAVTVAGFSQDVTFTVAMDTPLREAATRALDLAADIPPDARTGEPVVSDDAGTTYDNLDATFAELGIRHGSRLRVTLKTPETKENV